MLFLRLIFCPFSLFLFFLLFCLHLYFSSVIFLCCFNPSTLTYCLMPCPLQTFFSPELPIFIFQHYKSLQNRGQQYFKMTSNLFLSFYVISLPIASEKSHTSNLDFENRSVLSSKCIFQTLSLFISSIQALCLQRCLIYYWCYDLNDCVHSEFLCWKPIAQSDHFGR